MNQSVLMFVGGVIVIAGMTWFANIGEDSGNIMVAFVVLLWLVWFLKNGTQFQSIAAKVGI